MKKNGYTCINESLCYTEKLKHCYKATILR